MPKRVDDVRFRTERVLLAGVPLLVSGSNRDESLGCREGGVGVCGAEESVEADVEGMSKARRGRGWSIDEASSAMVGVMVGVLWWVAWFLYHGGVWQSVETQGGFQRNRVRVLYSLILE